MKNILKVHNKEKHKIGSYLEPVDGAAVDKRGEHPQSIS